MASLRPGLWAGCSSLDRCFASVRAAIGGTSAQRQRRLDHLADLILCDLGELPPLASIDRLPPARRARALIDADPARDLPVKDLAAMTGVSVDHLRHVFKDAYHLAPHAYRLQRRLALACDLLRSTPLGVAEIADRCGFADAFYFSRAFNRAFAISPTAFRARGHGAG